MESMTDMSSVFITVMRPDSQSCVAEVQIHCHLFLAYLYHSDVIVAQLTSSFASESGKFTLHNSTRVTLPAWVYQPSDSLKIVYPFANLCFHDLHGFGSTWFVLESPCNTSSMKSVWTACRNECIVCKSPNHLFSFSSIKQPF